MPLEKKYVVVLVLGGMREKKLIITVERPKKMKITSD